MEVIKLQRFELWKAKYKSFLKKFCNDFAFDPITEVFELRIFELERLTVQLLDYKILVNYK